MSNRCDSQQMCQLIFCSAAPTAAKMNGGRNSDRNAQRYTGERYFAALLSALPSL